MQRYPLYPHPVKLLMPKVSLMGESSLQNEVLGKGRHWTKHLSYTKHLHLQTPLSRIEFFFVRMKFLHFGIIEEVDIFDDKSFAISNLEFSSPLAETCDEAAQLWRSNE